MNGRTSLFYNNKFIRTTRLKVLKSNKLRTFWGWEVQKIKIYVISKYSFLQDYFYQTLFNSNESLCVNLNSSNPVLVNNLASEGDWIYFISNWCMLHIAQCFQLFQSCVYNIFCLFWWVLLLFTFLV